MLILANTTDSIQLITDSAAAMSVIASRVDNTSPPTPGRDLTAISSATTTTIVSSPSGSNIRNVRNIHATNVDAALPVNVTPLYNANGTTHAFPTFLLQPGDSLEFNEDLMFYVLCANTNSSLIRVLSADDTGGSNGTSDQQWFPTNGKVAVAGSTTYEMKGQLMLLHGTTTHTTAFSFGGTATLTNIDYMVQIHPATDLATGAVAAAVNANSASDIVANATAAVSGTKAVLRGIVRVNAAGTLIPQFKFSGAPGTPTTVKRGSFFKLVAIGSNTVSSIGTWT